eukprot:TRINITY_DN15914_c0_g1_i1.p1 TRINITY_DN15914_c0_g1~~TRINITY_DN15914_c0_g1_i1.p1  ORF type:complete len:168 (+),score=55.98 TRINITY_DN15914_c0_g1_i1:117-620(+)
MEPSEPAAAAPELLLLFGPPCAGKTAMFDRGHVSEGAERLCPADELARDVSLSLHKIISGHVLQPLLEGRSLVLEDTARLQLERSRASFIEAVHKRVPGCAITVLKVSPEGGKTQCMWAREFALAEHAVPLDERGRPTAATRFPEPDVDDWFAHATTPSVREGTRSG